MSYELPLARGGFQNEYGTRIPWTTTVDDRLCRIVGNVRGSGCGGGGGGGCGCATPCVSGGCQRSDPLLDAVLGRGMGSTSSSSSSGERERGGSAPSAADETRARGSSSSGAQGTQRRDLFNEENQVLDGFTNLDMSPGQVADLVRERQIANGGNRRQAADATLLDIFAASDFEFDLRQNLLQRDPGGTGRILGGRLVNSVLGDIEVPIGIDESGHFYGSVATSLSQRRMDELNGFGRGVINSYFYTGGPGGANNPFQKDVFLIDLGDAASHPWADRIFQGPADVACETKELCLYINGMAGRTLYLVRRPEPYYFVFRPPRANPMLQDFFCCNPDAFDPCERHGFYFTNDPVGGGVRNYINDGIAPLVFPMTSVIMENANMFAVKVDNNWPDMLFYQSTRGPFMGGKVMVLGQCP